LDGGGGRVDRVLAAATPGTYNLACRSLETVVAPPPAGAPIVVQALDLIDIAGAIDAPYRPVPIASLGAVTVSLLICEGPKTWHRAADRDELMLVLEGVITLDGPDGVLVVNEGEMARIPARLVVEYFSGMRSTVVQVHEAAAPDDGTADLPSAATVLGKSNVAMDVRRAPAYTWLPAGSIGGHAVLATRLVGASARYVYPAGPFAALVYRGVVDYESDGGSGSVVGSQVLVVDGGEPVQFGSDRGATVVVVLRDGVPPPVERPAA
jgi:hypothetical protein